MTAPEGTRIDQALATAFVSDCPDAFIAIDPEFRVIAWNRAAEALLGWSAQDVLGQLPPHLSAEQVEGIRSDLWGPIIEQFPDVEQRRHQDGHLVAVRIEREAALRDPSGKVLGWGRFMRAANLDELRLSLRNTLSLQLAEAVSTDEVSDAVAESLEHLLGARRALLLRLDAEQLMDLLPVGLGRGVSAEVATEVVRAVVASRATERTVVRVDGADVPALLVPMGPSRWVLGLLEDDGPIVESAWPLAQAIAGEAWAALRRLDLVAELEARVAVLEASNAVSRSAGLDMAALLAGICEQAARALDCGRTAVYLRDAEADALVLAHLHGYPDEAGARGAATQLQELLRERPRELQVLQPGAGLDGLPGPWATTSGARAAMAIPLTLGEDQLGVLLAAHTAAHPDGFPRLSRQVGEAVAQHAALALVNARMFLGARTDVDRLEQLDERKTDHVAGVSHDLRSPLAALRASVRTLQRLDELKEEVDRAEYLEIMERQVNRLSGMVDDMLLGARLDAGRLQPDQTARVDLAALVRGLHRLLAPDHRLRVDVREREDDMAPPAVCGDARHLERVVQNLLDNALIHTPDATRVTVATRQQGAAVVLTVHDDGPGIPAHTLGSIFDRYGAAGPRRGGSTGLGLYTTRGIVHGHGGTIDVRSASGEGTTFEVRLPAADEHC